MDLLEGSFSKQHLLFKSYALWYWASLVAHILKKSVCNAGDQGLIPGSGYPLEKGMATTHFSIIFWDKNNV